MYKVLLICTLSPSIGIGHLSRLLALANYLKKINLYVEFMIFGDKLERIELENYKAKFYPFKLNFIEEVYKHIKKDNFDVVVFDLPANFDSTHFRKFFAKIKQMKVKIIGIDSLVNYRDILDKIWVPSFNFDTSQLNDHIEKIKFGWDSFIINKRLDNRKWSPGHKLLVLTGGSDAKNLSEYLPAMLDSKIDQKAEINWVQGPFANIPNIPSKPKLKWIIHKAPESLDQLITESNYVLTVFGVSFFEVIQYGIPSVVFSPYDGKDDKELSALKNENVAMVAKNLEEAIDMVNGFRSNANIARMFSKNSLEKFKKNGAEQLSLEIHRMLSFY